jgi:enoyl-CoA hydratase
VTEKGKVKKEYPRDGVVEIVLSNPDQRNALSEELGEELVQIAKEVSEDPRIRVVLVRGEGKGFSAGGDLKMLLENTTLKPHEVWERMHRFYGSFLCLRRIPQPTVALIHGFAYGAGVALALACDFRIATKNSLISLNFARLGLAPGMGVTYFLTRLLGHGKALELLLTGKVIRGEEAERIGLVHRAVSEEEFSFEVDRLVEELLLVAPIAVRWIKELVYASLDLTLENLLRFEATGQALTFATEDIREGISAVKGKNSPTFQGR